MQEDEKKLNEMLDAIIHHDSGPEVMFGLITLLDEMHDLIGKGIPYYMLLYYILRRIPDPMNRVDILGHLQDLAEKQWPEKQAKDFITEASCLVHFFTRLHALLLNNKLPNIYKEKLDKNEFVLFIQNIRPYEMVAITQSIYYTHEVRKEYVNLDMHILTHSKYLNKLLTVDAFNFCKYLYIAHGFCMHLLDGTENSNDKSQKQTELPSIDNLDCDLRNQCFDFYIELRLKHILAKLKKNNRRLYPANEDEAYSQLCKSLSREYYLVAQNASKIRESTEAQDSMVTVMQFLAQYTQDNKHKFINKTMDNQQQPKIINVNGDYVEHKEVMYEVNNVEDGGIGIQIRTGADDENPQSSLYPRKNKYTEVVHWLEKQKTQGTDFFVAAGRNRSELCRKLTKIFGWEVDQNSLRKAQEDYENKKN